MTLRQRALLDVVKVLCLGLLVGTLITLATEVFGLAPVALAVMLILLVYLGKTAYDIRVAQLTLEAERVQRALKEQR